MARPLLACQKNYETGAKLPKSEDVRFEWDPMKPPTPPAEPAMALPGYYTYQEPGSGTVIHLSLETLETILGEVMTGFGAIPRRGAEVGGILTGRVAGQEIWIEEFAMTACEHRRGPSFLLSDDDQQAFAATFERCKRQENYPVGLFRSNTREENVLTSEDRALFGRYFPAPASTFLLIRPYAAKTSTGTFFVYQDGALPGSSPNVFPFQRWEIEGTTAPRRPVREPRNRPDAPPAPENREQPLLAPDYRPGSTASTVPESIPAPPLDSGPAPHDLTPPDPQFSHSGSIETSQPRRGWIWIPLSFIFLLLGVLLGFQSALSFFPRTVSLDASSFALGLTATGKDDNLYIKWNRESPAIKSAERGQLEIRDGQYVKSVALDANSLQTGSVVYPPLSATVGLRLQVYFKGTTSITETLDWSKKPEQAPSPASPQ